MKNGYLIQLEMPGMKTNFEVHDKELTIDAFKNNKVLIIDKPNGDQFCIRMEDYNYMSIDAVYTEGVKDED